jgi:anti-sigma regulatory factor (Ser/Thr protein kinase)
LKIKSKRRTALCSIVEILSEKADKDGRDFEGMKVFADQRLSEPFELSDLVKVVESELSRCAEERNYFEHVATIRLHTEDERIEEANELVGNMLTESGLSEESAAALAVAFREAMDNAARHGNKSDPDRLVTVEYLVDREKVTITVSDEGEGFDTEVYLSRGVSGDPVEAARERNRAGGVGGLGIMLMLKCVDKLEYKYSGNTVTLTKYIRAS